MKNHTSSLLCLFLNLYAKHLIISIASIKSVPSLSKNKYQAAIFVIICSILKTKKASLS